MHVACHAERAAVGKDFHIELRTPRDLLVAACGARIVRRRLKQSVSDVKFGAESACVPPAA